jgi:capsular polysaccharide biosynthesis protein
MVADLRRDVRPASGGLIDLLSADAECRWQLCPGEMIRCSDRESVCSSRDDLSRGYFWLPGEVDAVEVYQVHDVDYFPKAYLAKCGRPLSGGNVEPQHARHAIEKFLLTSPVADGSDSIKEGFIFLHSNFPTYGHLLLEMLPKLLVYKLLSSIKGDLPLILPADSPRYVDNWIALLGIDTKALVRCPTGKSLRVKRCFISDMGVSFYLFSSLMQQFVRFSIEAADGAQNDTAEASARLFISRRSRRSAGFDFRELVNEGQLEEVALTAGFTIVEPERLSIQEQIRIFSGAQTIAGELSSGLHNAIFTAPGAAVLQFNPFNSVQRSIAFSQSQRLVSILPDDGILRGWPLKTEQQREFTIDPDRFRRAIDAASEARPCELIRSKKIA